MAHSPLKKVRRESTALADGSGWKSARGNGAISVPAVNLSCKCAEARSATKCRRQRHREFWHVARIRTTGVMGTATHIHVGAAVKNGPVIIPLTKGASGDWTVPAGAKLMPNR